MRMLGTQPGRMVFTRQGAFPIQIRMSMATHLAIPCTGTRISLTSHIKHYKLPRINTIIASAAPNGSQADESSDGGNGTGGGGRSWEGPGVGPEGLAEDPVLQDLIMGMGSSGQGPGEKPPGAPGGLIKCHFAKKNKKKIII